MNIDDFKMRFLTLLDDWARGRIDEMVKSSPVLAIPSVYMKRATHNIIAKNKETWGRQIDNTALFICDENGDIDCNTLFDDMMQMIKSVPDYHFEFGFIHGHISNGVISIDLPDNIATVILFGSKRSITFTEDDFLELKSLLLT